MAIPKRRHEKATETAPTTDDGAAPAKKSRLDDDPKNDPKLPTNTKMPESYDFIEQVPSGYAKIVTWNVNSLAAACNKGFKKYLKAEDPDVICLQETKANQPMAMLIDKKWYPYQYWNCCKSGKKGYAGTAVFSKFKPISKSYGLSDSGLDNEGRTITLEFANFYLVACYVPNAGQKLVRLGFKQDWDRAMNKYLGELEEKKPVIYTGDLNVAHQEIDLARPDQNHRSAGFTNEEREGFTRLLQGIHAPRIDVYRHEHPDARVAAYTFYGYRTRGREKGLGWRLDYFVASEALMSSTHKCLVRHECYGASDHLPLVLYLKKQDAFGDEVSAAVKEGAEKARQVEVDVHEDKK